MRDAKEALAYLKQSSGLAKLEFNQHGYVEIVFDQSISVTIVALDANQMEFVSYLDLPDFEVSVSVLRALMLANHLGDAVGAGRLALDPKDDTLLFCERLDATELDPLSLERRLLSFVKHVAFWRSEGAAKLLADGMPPARAAEPVSSELFIRI